MENVFQRSEVVRDFSGWTWSILSNEIESTECNTIYVLLSFLLGYKSLENVDIKYIQEQVGEEFYNELKKVAMQFYLSYDKTKNEEILKKLSANKEKLLKMKNPSEYVIEITAKKKKKLRAVKHIVKILNDPFLLLQITNI